MSKQYQKRFTGWLGKQRAEVGIARVCQTVGDEERWHVRKVEERKVCLNDYGRESGKLESLGWRGHIRNWGGQTVGPGEGGKEGCGGRIKSQVEQ